METPVDWMTKMNRKTMSEWGRLYLLSATQFLGIPESGWKTEKFLLSDSSG
jgi:hypothetical protein